MCYRQRGPAADSLDQDKADLDKAEAEGRKHSHGEDPALKREKKPGAGGAAPSR